MKLMLNGKFKSLLIVICLAAVLVVAGTTTVSAIPKEVTNEFTATLLEMLDLPLPHSQEPLPYGSILGEDTYEYVCEKLVMVPGDPENWEDGLRLEPDEFSFEWWYFDAHLADALDPLNPAKYSSVVVVYFTKSMFNLAGPSTPWVSITIVPPPPGEPIVETFTADGSTDISFSTEGCDVKIGDNTVNGSLTNYATDPATPSSYEIYAKNGDVEVNLTMTGIVPSWRPGHGHSFLGSYDDNYAWLVPIPSGITTGAMIYNGESHPVVGSGYHDHNWGNVRLYDHQKYWWWGRAQLGDYTVVTADVRMKNKYGNNEWIGSIVVLDENGAYIDSRVSNVSVTHTETDIKKHPDEDFNGNSNGKIAHTVTFRAENIESDENDGVWDWAEVRYEYVQLLASKDLTPGISQGMTDMEIYIADLIGRNPWYTRFLCKTYLTINIDGENAIEEEGYATLELMDME